MTPKETYRVLIEVKIATIVSKRHVKIGYYIQTNKLKALLKRPLYSKYLK
jgi:hypothetical protein